MLFRKSFNFIISFCLIKYSLIFLIFFKILQIKMIPIPRTPVEKENLTNKKSLELRSRINIFEFNTFGILHQKISIFFLILNFLKEFENEFWLIVIRSVKLKPGKQDSVFSKSLKRNFISFFSDFRLYIINLFSFVPICFYQISSCEKLWLFLKNSDFFLFEAIFVPLVIIDSQKKIKDVVLTGSFGKEKKGKKNLLSIFHQKKAIFLKTFFQNLKKNKKIKNWQLKNLKIKEKINSKKKFLQYYKTIFPVNFDSIFFLQNPDSKGDFVIDRDNKKKIFQFSRFSRAFLFFPFQKGLFLNTRFTIFFFFLKKGALFHIKLPRFLEGGQNKKRRIKKTLETNCFRLKINKKVFYRIFIFFFKKKSNILFISHVSFNLISQYPTKETKQYEAIFLKNVHPDRTHWESFFRINSFGASSTRSPEKFFLIKDLATFEILVFEKSFFYISNQIFIDCFHKVNLSRLFCSVKQNLYFDPKLFTIFLKKFITDLIFQNIVREIIQDFSAEFVFELTLSVLIFFLNTEFLEFSLGNCEILLITYIVHCCFYVFFIFSNRKKIMLCFLYKILKNIKSKKRILKILKKNIK